MVIHGDTMDDTQLTPGLYIQSGGHIKALGTAGSGRDLLDLLMGNGRVPDVEKLTEMVSWVFIALDARRSQAQEIPFNWMRGGDELPPTETPLQFNWLQEVGRIDESLQTYSVAYLYKERLNGRLIRLRFLDPASMEPDERTKTLNGYTNYLRTTVTGGKDDVPAKDLIVIQRRGLREVDPAPSAGLATKLAGEILYGMGLTNTTFYGNNALPITLLFVPPETQENEKTRLQKWFWRVMNPAKYGTVENRVLALSKELKTERLTLNPKELEMGPLEDSQINSILAAHRVPRSIVFEDANYATAADKRRAFVSTMGARLNMIANAINSDPDVQRTGYSLLIKVQRHWAMSRDEQDASLAFTRYLTGMYPEAAAYLMNITEDDFPPEMRGRVFLPMAVNPPSPTASSADAGMIDDASEMPETGMDGAKAREIDALRRFVANGTHLKRSFQSDVLTPAEVAGYVTQFTFKGAGVMPVDAPFQGEPPTYP